MGPARHPMVAAALAATIVIAGCRTAENRSSEALASSEAVAFTTSDGVRLEGRLFGARSSTSAGIVFARMLPADQTSWYGEAVRYADAGYRTLTFNLRGYCPGGDGGCSAGTKAPEAAPLDVAAAVAYLRSAGVTRVAIVGASIGGTSALVHAATDPSAIAAVITLSAPETFGSLFVDPEMLARITAAKLFVAATGDASAAAAAQSFYDWSGQPKRFEVLPSDDHGTDMLSGNAGGRVRDLMDLWLGTYLPLAPAT